MKQIQKQGESSFLVTTGKYDFIKMEGVCNCRICLSFPESLNPEITMDHEMEALKKPRFLNMLRQRKWPQFPILDTIVLVDGNIHQIVHLSKQTQFNFTSIEDFFLKRKRQIQLQYQKEKYMKQHKQYIFGELDYNSEKILKQLESNSKYISQIQNQIVRIKIKDKQDIILNQKEFKNLFKKSIIKYIQISKIQYIQIHPIMYNQQQQSYIRNIKYQQKNKQNKLYKYAKIYYLLWIQSNDTISKMQYQVYQYINKQLQSQLYYLLYITYKIILFFQHICSVKIISVIFSYITINKGLSFFLQSCYHLKIHYLQPITTSQPKKKHQLPQKPIQLKQQMKNVFNSFKSEYQSLRQLYQDIQKTLCKDKQYSDQVYKMAKRLPNSAPTLYSVLQSGDMKYKKIHLGL